jgi:hypothetical protein
MKIRLVSAAVLAVLSTSALAAAQPAQPAQRGSDYTEQKVDGGTVVTFPGDQLPGDASDPYYGIVRVPPRALRAGLIKPRMNFVPELLKSVEHL